MTDEMAGYMEWAEPDDLRTGMARAVAKQVVASRKMQRDNGLVYGAAYEAADAAIAQFTAHLESEGGIVDLLTIAIEDHDSHFGRSNVPQHWTNQARVVIAAMKGTGA